MKKYVGFAFILVVLATSVLAMEEDDTEQASSTPDGSLAKTMSNALTQTQLQMLSVVDQREGLEQERADLEQENKKLRSIIIDQCKVMPVEMQELQTGHDQNTSNNNTQESVSAQGGIETETSVECCHCGKLKTRCSCRGRAAAKYLAAGTVGAGLFKSVEAIAAASTAACTIL